MINDQLLSQFSLLLKEVAPPLIRVTDTPSAPSVEPHWTPGDKLPATVLANLPNGRFYVQVDDQTLELNLPKNTQPGDQLELVYVGNSPRLTFTMASSPTLPVTPPASAHLPAVAEPASGQPAPADLSETAYLLGQLSQRGSSAAQGVMAQLPVLAAPPGTVSQLATALAQALSASGLFYESHQAQWVQGERPLAQLLQEPQAQQGPGQLQQASPMQQGPGQPPQAQLGQDPALLEQMPAASATHTPYVHQQQAQSASIAAYALLAGMEPKGAALLQQQLQVLNSGTIQWSGAVWPGQQMQWEISGLPVSQPEAGQQWQTRLNLTLPNLGAVSAWLLMGPQGLQVRLHADAEQTRQLLATSSTALDSAMQAAGLSLTYFSVEANG